MPWNRFLANAYYKGNVGDLAQADHFMLVDTPEQLAKVLSDYSQNPEIGNVRVWDLEHSQDAPAFEVDYENGGINPS